MISYGTKGVAVSLAWFMQRFISAFHSAVRGAQLFLRGSTKYLVRHKHIKPEQVKMLEEVGPFCLVLLYSVPS